MNNFPIFMAGLIVTLIAGMGVITSEVFLGYKKSILADLKNKRTVIKPNNNLDNQYSIN